MLSNLFLLSVTIVTAIPLVAAHGKIAVLVGDQGGNATALGIQGGIVPGAGSNDVTEVDTTVFKSTKLLTNGLGHTTGQGKNTVSMIAQVMEQSGPTLPQVSANGTISGTFHIVTSDGAGPLSAVVDPTGTGTFANGIQVAVTQQVPGKGGNIKKANARRDFSLFRRATNINEDFPVEVSLGGKVSACTGTMGGVNNVCLLKLANSNAAGPFGGVVPFQMAPSATVAPTPVGAQDVAAPTIATVTVTPACGA